MIHFAIFNATLILNKFPVDFTARNAEKEWKFWLLQFEDDVPLTVDAGISLLKVLRLHLTAATFEYVKGCKSYDEAVAEVKEVYVKPKNKLSDKTMALNSAQENMEAYITVDLIINSVSTIDSGTEGSRNGRPFSSERSSTLAVLKRKCYFCGKL
ncbi:hypothetical protein T07_1140 [Trichinella nelsoni]|uniref:Uncharacterized protein n=1 Tax=Trichinella nelsoni TaxID=6336 RepID=A0A0V0SJY2_9BILA|nr:hypothetical protein T07_1140 [Trichinella nelsoni]